MSSLRLEYEKSRTIGPLHTGGPVAINSDGSHIATCVGEEVVITRLTDGLEVNRLVTDTEDVHSICFTPSSFYIAVFTASLALHIFEKPLISAPKSRLHPSRTIAKAHDAPVHVCKVDSTSTLLASGSADGVVKVWDIARGYVTHVFKGHGGIVSALAFRRTQDHSVTVEPVLQLITASADTRLRIFDLSTQASRAGASKPIAVLEGHVSIPRGLDVTSDGRWLISGGRDAVALLWDFSPSGPSVIPTSKKKAQKKGNVPSLARTITVLERIEAAGWISNSDELQFFTGGEKGVIKVWNAENGVLAYSMGLDSPESHEILFAEFVSKANSILAINSDQIITHHSITNRSPTQQLVGFNDEIVAASFLSSKAPDSHIAIATNSPVIKIYSVSGNDARLLSGHTEIVLSLDHSSDGRMLVSGSKDNAARLWAYSDSLENWSCVAVCEGHAESVGAVALSRKSSEETVNGDKSFFVFTGSQDRTIKMWNVSSQDRKHQAAPAHLKSMVTLKAHDKDINALDVSPNDMFLASGSQDKTAKIFEIEYHPDGSGGPRGGLKLVGTCKGHKRGVWTVKFGRAERVLATGSGDSSIKLWNLSDFSCVKTFEGHTNSVLQLSFLNHDTQLLSTASDGLLKSWNVRTEECIATMDNHEDKIWALAVSSDESTIVTGAADSTITFWKDCTEERERERQSRRETAVLQEQDLLNFMTVKDYHNALLLALSLDQPGRLLSLFQQVLFAPSLSCAGSADDTRSKSQAGIEGALKQLPAPQLIKLLKHVRDWNANAKTSGVAQKIIYSLLRLWTVDQIVDAFNSNLKHDADALTIGTPDAGLTLIELVQALLPYTERHLARLDRLVQDTYIIDYVLKEMDGGLIGDDEMDLDL